MYGFFMIAFILPVLASFALFGLGVFLAVRGRSLGRFSHRWPLWGALACVVIAAAAFLAPRVASELVIRPVGGVATSADSFDSFRPVPNLQPPARGGPLSHSQEGGSPPAPSTGGSSTVNDQPHDAVFFRDYGTNPFVDAEDDRLSTFAVDVDTASYVVARAYIQQGHLPDPASVRAEEFVNRFRYGYPAPESGGPFTVHLEAAPSPFGTERHTMLRVGIQGRPVRHSEDRRPVTVVFVIDVSGSMDGERIRLVQDVVLSFLDVLSPTDRVALVTYGSDVRSVLDPVTVREARSIRRAVKSLETGGSTYAEAGLRHGFTVAGQEAAQGRDSHVFLLSDGVANVGATGSEGVLRSVRSHSSRGVHLSTVGVGMGNYNDILMERLANDGDGIYSYVDTAREADRLAGAGLPSLLDIIARDARVQVEFNPSVVRSYRLLGYENRDVADDEFRDDDLDAGEIGAGHSVTALYEMKLVPGAQGVGAVVRLRHEDPDSGEFLEDSWEFDSDSVLPSARDASREFRLAASAAQFAEILGESYWARDESLDDLIDFAGPLSREFSGDGDVAEFLQMVRDSDSLQRRDEDRP